MSDVIVNYNSMKWQDADEIYPQDTKIKVLRDDEGGRTVLLKLAKGFKMGGHCHIEDEQHFVLKGQYEMDGKVYPQGTYQLIHSNMTHGPFTSKTGAEVLVVWH